MSQLVTFKAFIKKNQNSMKIKYPFLSPSQIKSRLRTEWKKIAELTKAKTNNNKLGDSIGKKTYFTTSRLFDMKEDIDLHFNSIKSTYSGGIFRVPQKVPEVISKIDINKAGILKARRPAKNKAIGRVQFFPDGNKKLKQTNYDQERQKDSSRTLHSKENLGTNALLICRRYNLNDSDTENNDNHHQNKEIKKISKIKKLSKNKSSNMTKLSYENGHRDQGGNKNYFQFDNFVNKTMSPKNTTNQRLNKYFNITKSDVDDNGPISNDEFEDNNLNDTWEDDDDDNGVLLVRTDDNIISGMRENVDLQIPSVSPCRDQVMNNTDIANLNTPHSNSVRLRENSPEIITINNTPKKRLSRQQTKCVLTEKVTENKKISSHKEPCTNSLKANFNTNWKNHHKPINDSIIDRSSAQKAKQGMKNMEYNWESSKDNDQSSEISNSNELSSTASSIKQHDKRFRSRLKANESRTPDSVKLEESPQCSWQSIFYSQQSDTGGSTREPSKVIINSMFDDLDVEKNSCSNPIKRRLLSSRSCKTTSNFQTLLFQDEENIFF